MKSAVTSFFGVWFEFFFSLFNLLALKPLKLSPCSLLAQNSDLGSPKSVVLSLLLSEIGRVFLAPFSLF